MSNLVIEPQVPQGKYRILSAAHPNLVLEMQTGGDFRVHARELNQSNKAQIWKIVVHSDKYKIKSNLNCGILGIPVRQTSNVFVESGILDTFDSHTADSAVSFTGSQNQFDNRSLICSLHDHFWTIDPRGSSFIIRDIESDDALALSDEKSLTLGRCNGQLACRWLLLLTELFKPTKQGYLLRTKDKPDHAADCHPGGRYFYGYSRHGNNNQRWDITDLGNGNYQFKCRFEDLYLGWKDLRDGAETVASKTPYSWTVRRASNDVYQLWAVSDIPGSFGLGELHKDQILKLSANPALWIITTGA